MLGLHCYAGFSPVVGSGFYFLVAVWGLLLSWSIGSRHLGFCGCGSWGLEHRLNCGAVA